MYTQTKKSTRCSSRSATGMTVILATMLSLGALLKPAQAEAKLFEAWASALTGVANGKGKTDRDFYTWTGGAATGIEVGAKVLFFTAYVDYLRFFQGTGANLISVNLGADNSFKLPALPISIVYRFAASGYLGSLGNGTRTANDGTVIDSENMQTRGIGARGGVGLAYTFLKVFSLGIRPMVGYHYFFGGSANGESQSSIDISENSHGIDYQAMLFLRVGLGI